MKLIKVEQTPKSDDKKLIATFCKCKDGKAMCKDKDKVKIAILVRGTAQLLALCHNLSYRGVLLVLLMK
jgi:hypothetical protein